MSVPRSTIPATWSRRILKVREIALLPAGAGLGFALPSLTFGLLDTPPAFQAGLAGGLFNAARQTGGALAVALFGALVSGGAGAFLTGMRVSLAISTVLLLGSTIAAWAAFRAAPVTDTSARAEVSAS